MKRRKVDLGIDLCRFRRCMPQMVAHLLETETARKEVRGDRVAQSVRPILSKAQAQAFLPAPCRSRESSPGERPERLRQGQEHLAMGTSEANVLQITEHGLTDLLGERILLSFSMFRTAEPN